MIRALAALQADAADDRRRHHIQRQPDAQIGHRRLQPAQQHPAGQRRQESR